MKPTIRTALLWSFLLVGFVPTVLFGFATYERTVSREFADVSDRHLLLAQNLASALERYDRELQSAIDYVVASINRPDGAVGKYDILQALHIEQVAFIDLATARPRMVVLVDTEKPAMTFTMERVKQLNAAATGGATRYTPVERRRQFGNVIHAVTNRGGELVVATIRTGYFAELQSEVQFGDKGHAAIVDQIGNIIAHPDPAWVKEARNIASVSAVTRLMRGETGIETFYSPAVEADMIAGIATVRNTGWGVMVPQPVSEVYAKAREILQPAMLVLLLCLMAAIYLALQAIRRIALPMEAFADAMRRNQQMGLAQAVTPEIAENGFAELTQVIEAYNSVAEIVHRSKSEMEERAHQDSVTGIGNREYFEAGSTKHLARAALKNQKAVLMFVDLDHFKEINDSRGHAVGDAVLRDFARQLFPAVKRFLDSRFRGTTGAFPIIGRIGGDEFAMLIPVTDAVDDFRAFCADLRAALPGIIHVDGVEIPCTTSVGGAIYPTHGEDLESLMRRADVALYQAKAQGRNCFELYGVKSVLGGKTEIRAAVSEAIDRNELTLEYQPKYCLSKKEVTAVEALIRWRHPVHGLVQPGAFLPAIQNTSLMIKLGEWVIERAVTDIGGMDAQGVQLRVAVNIGAEHFNKETFFERTYEVCNRHQFDPRRLQIEITEDVIDSSGELFERNAKRLQNAGVRIAVDDFGRGYSNLSRLASLNVDVIKLDRSMIWDAEKDVRCNVVMKSAVDMAHALGAAVVVEGVETMAHVRLAAEAGADALQGFYFSPSLDSRALLDWIRRRDQVEPLLRIAPVQKKVTV